MNSIDLSDLLLSASFAKIKKTIEQFLTNYPEFITIEVTFFNLRVSFYSILRDALISTLTLL